MIDKDNMLELLEKLIALAVDQVEELEEQTDQMGEANKFCPLEEKPYSNEDFEAHQDDIVEARLVISQARLALAELNNAPSEMMSVEKKATKQLKVSFLAQGHVNQTIEVPEDMDPVALQKGLNNGGVLTSVQEGGMVWFLDKSDDAECNFGTVVSVDNRLEYEDFEVEEA